MGNHYMIKGKILLLPFPYDELNHEKIRPVLSLTNYIGEYSHIVVAFISSKIKNSLKDSDLIIQEDSSHFSKTGLKVSSVVHLHRLLTVSKSTIFREIGYLPEDIIRIAIEKVKNVF